MNCPVCGGKSRVANVRDDGETIKRYRECPFCLYRFTTCEIENNLLEHLLGSTKKDDKKRRVKK